MHASSFFKFVDGIFGAKTQAVDRVAAAPDEDLDAVCADLTAEFGALSGGRPLVTGGGGFPGDYLVQFVLPWNETRVADAKIDLTVGERPPVGELERPNLRAGLHRTDRCPVV